MLLFNRFLPNGLTLPAYGRDKVSACKQEKLESRKMLYCEAALIKGSGAYHPDAFTGHFGCWRFLGD